MVCCLLVPTDTSSVLSTFPDPRDSFHSSHEETGMLFEKGWDYVEDPLLFALATP